MKEQIKKLRVKCDGLAQLTKELKPINKYIIDIKYIPTDLGLSLEEWVKMFEKTGYAFVDSSDCPEASKSIIELPTIDKEIEKAVDSLYLGRAWLGKVLGELGNENPYGSGYKTKEDIIHTQDVSTIVKELNKFPEINNLFEGLNWKEASHIERVDHLRTQIEKLIVEVKGIPTKDLSREFAIARTNCYTHLCEARFWLGFEMKRIKNN